MSQGDDIYDLRHDDQAEVFCHVRRGRQDLTSNILVEDLFENDKELLALFYVVRTCIGVEWYRFKNIKELVPNSEEWWRQLDMNRVVHTYHSLIKDIREGKPGVHCGDCTSVSCSCNRCRAEWGYLETVYLKNLALAQSISPSTLLAILLSRDESLITNADNRKIEMTPLDEEAKKHKETHLLEWIDRVYAKYPREYDISLKRFIEHWITLSVEEINWYVTRAEQIMAWCDELPVCPGVPWW